jgi:hypothetical protein
MKKIFLRHIVFCVFLMIVSISICLIYESNLNVGRICAVIAILSCIAILHFSAKTTVGNWLTYDDIKTGVEFNLTKSYQKTDSNMFKYELNDGKHTYFYVDETCYENGRYVKSNKNEFPGMYIQPDFRKVK